MTRTRALLLALLAIAGVALAVVLIAGGSGDGGDGGDGAVAGRTTGSADTGDADAPVDPIDAMTARQRAGTTVVLRFHGTSPPGYVLEALRERRAAGVILFADNVTTPESLQAMTAEIHRANPGALVMVDQEGGDIRIVPFAGPASGQAWRSSPRDARSVAAQAGRALHELGIDVVLGPVADAGRPGTALAGRSFAGDVPALTAATVSGWLRGGVLPTAKHFPGLGASATNTDDAAADVPVDRATLDAVDLPPFVAAIDAGVPLVMSSHAVYPALDPGRPASQSGAILTDLLRGELGFDGVVITDSLEAEAVRERPSTPAAAVRSMAAGADLLLTTGRGSYTSVMEAVRRRAARDPAFDARVREAVGRVLALQRQSRAQRRG